MGATQLIFLVLIFSLSCAILPSASMINSLRKGSSLFVNKPNEVLVSLNGVFSAGFHQVGDNAYSFAIWFNNSKSIVWMANRDKPVNGRRSKLSLLEDGNLVLTDAGQSIVWATNTEWKASLVRLQLKDTGNLVLHASENVTLWQSFDSPTDTLLPYQPLTRYTKLISSRSQSNYSSGYYRLFFDDNNVLRLAYDGPETSSIYWPSPWLSDSEAERSRYNDSRVAVFDSWGHFISSDHVNFRSADFGAGVQRRLSLDFDGNLRLYSLDEINRAWIVSWQAMSAPCRINGACGPNGLCNYDPASGRRCSCPLNYKMKNHTDWSYGCEPEFNLDCNDPEAGFLGIPHVDFYGYNINIERNFTLKRCKKRCLELCHCKGFLFRFDLENGVHDCYLKRDLRNGHNSANARGVFYFKLPKANISSAMWMEKIGEFKLNCSEQAMKQLYRTYKKNSQNDNLEFLLWFAIVLLCFEIVSIFLLWLYLYRTGLAGTKDYLLAPNGFKRFTYAELKKATQSFNDNIGRGGGGVVYKGVLSDHRVAAVKQLNDASQGGEAEFLAEVSTIGRLNHMHLIDVWGYCAEGKHRLLVYEYMELGSLAKNLYSNALDWQKRFNIAVGTAKGLAYLHEECLEWVLHCDVKPENILLDSNYQPKVADFGLSKLLNRGGANHSSFSTLRGTRGYMAPEWVYNLPITSKVDVYSFGVVVLEMVTGKDPSGVHHVIGGGEMEHRRLVTWARGKINEAAKSESSWIEEIIDPMLEGMYDKRKMEVLGEVALQCIEEDKDARPTMSEVVQILLYHEDENPAKL